MRVAAALCARRDIQVEQIFANQRLTTRLSSSIVVVVVVVVVVVI